MRAVAKLGLWQLKRRTRNFLKEKGHSRSQKRYIRRPAPSASTRGPSRRGCPVAGHLDRRGPWGPWLVDAAAAARDPSPPTCAKRAAASAARRRSASTGRATCRTRRGSRGRTQARPLHRDRHLDVISANVRAPSLRSNAPTRRRMDLREHPGRDGGSCRCVSTIEITAREARPGGGLRASRCAWWCAGHTGDTVSSGEQCYGWQRGRDVPGLPRCVPACCARTSVLRRHVPAMPSRRRR